MSSTATNVPPPYPSYPQYERRKTRWWIPLVIIAVIILMIIGLFVGFIAFLSSAFSTPDIKVKSESVLRLAGKVEEQSETSPFAALLGSPASTVSLYEAMQAIRQAADDEKIKGIFIEGDKFSIDNVKRQELREELIKFKESGKFIYAFLEVGTKGDYYLASVADSIFMPLEGRVDLSGFGASSLFFKGTFDKLGISCNVLQFEDFKSAGESFSRRGWSDSAKKALRPILADAENVFISGIAEGRNIDPSAVRRVMEEVITSPDTLLALGLIDRICGKGEVENLLLAKTKGKSIASNDDNEDEADEADGETAVEEAEQEEKSKKKTKGRKSQESAKPRYVSLARYIAATSPADEEASSYIAVVTGSGPIVTGSGSQPDPFGGGGSQIGSDAFIKELRKARDNKKVKAIVVRIDSPGGSVIASDAIWQEINAAREVKPVYASMGSVAASGGYYMAMACEKIFAHPSTITGSIGVILMFPNFTKLMDNIGVTVDTVQQTPNAFFLDPTMPLQKSDMDKLSREAEDIYKRFVQRAADSRGVSYDYLRARAKGRVWLGRDAKENGLIDYTGGLYDAIAYAKSAIDAESAGVKLYPEVKDPFEEFIKELFNQGDSDASAPFATIRRAFVGNTSLVADVLPAILALPPSLLRQMSYAYILQQSAAKEKALVAMPALPVID